jgi:hypothetical protein
MLAELGMAQGPTIGFTSSPEAPGPALVPMATLGEPQVHLFPATRPAAWEQGAPPRPLPQDAALLVPPGQLPPTATYTGNYTTLPRPLSDAVAVNPSGEPLLLPCAEAGNPPSQTSAWFENMSLFFGFDGSKEPADLGVNANFGYRFAFNWGLPIFEQPGIGIQVGTAVNYSQNALRILPFIDGTVDRWQSFTTVGVFQRSTRGLRWGVVYDFRFDDYYDRTSAGQWRAQLGYEANSNNELGFWATIRDHGDSAAIGPLSFSVEPISQWNFYWRHIWPNEIVTRLWIGLASEHSRFNVLIPGQPQVNHPFTFGGDFYVPLTDNLAIFGEAHFITPNDAGTVTATLGVALYPGSARGTARSRFAPLLPVANNTTFALDVR